MGVEQEDEEDLRTNGSETLCCVTDTGDSWLHVKAHTPNNEEKTLWRSVKKQAALLVIFGLERAREERNSQDCSKVLSSSELKKWTMLL